MLGWIRIGLSMGIENGTLLGIENGTLPGGLEIGSRHWAPVDDYDGFGNLVESAEEERQRSRRRVEHKLGQMAAQ